MNGLNTGDATVRGPKKNENLLKIRSAGIRIEECGVDKFGDYSILLTTKDAA